jgi:hypothetical protein
MTTTALASSEYLRIAASGGDALEQIMRRGERPDAEALVGWEYRGMNIAFWASRSPIQKFIKGFYKARDGRVMGYNEPVLQNGPERRWLAKPNDDDPKRFGFYLVTGVDPTSRDNAYLNALLLDYGRGGNSILDPSRGLRDYLVRVNPGSDELILGKASYAVGPLRPMTNYFLLERHRHTGWAPA